MNDYFLINGGQELSGEVEISGSKNAALPILAACLACSGQSSLSNLPAISDVDHFLALLEILGAEVSKEADEVKIKTDNLKQMDKLDHHYIAKMRASILLLAPMLVRFGEVKMAFPGGCVLGKRSVDSHLRAFTAFGAEVIDCQEYLHLRLPKGKFIGGTVVLPEISVTATENAIIAASFAEGESEIRMAAAEPHVQNLCELLKAAGAQIDGIGTHSLKIIGHQQITGLQGTIVSDYLEAGTFLLAAILTDSEIVIKNFVQNHLDSFLEKLQEAGAEFSISDQQIFTHKRKNSFRATSIQTGVFPKFPTDLHPQFAVLMTQAIGTSKIFETLFERKFAYLLELEKMGAEVQILNPHEFLVHGPKKLHGVPVASQDIRAGAAMILAALLAEGQTEISNILYLDRGYEKLEEKLRALGADISRKNR